MALAESAKKHVGQKVICVNTALTHDQTEALMEGIFLKLSQILVSVLQSLGESNKERGCLKQNPSMRT